MRTDIKPNLIYFGWFVATLLTVICGSTPNFAMADSSDNQTTYYFVRHAEIDKKNPDKPLTNKGKQRAEALIEYMKNNHITHIYATHTDRTRDTVTPLAKARHINVVQSPTPGSTIKGEVVNNRSKGKVAIKSLIKDLKSLPQGSSVMVSANSGNIFGVMAGLGVPVVGDDSNCSNAPAKCLPCKAKKCFPKKEFNNVWIVKVDSNGKASLAHAKYGE